MPSSVLQSLSSIALAPCRSVAETHIANTCEANNINAPRAIIRAISKQVTLFIYPINT
nr:MAG TPA: hypothetical protein [Caudoviricetes sp.]